MYNVKVFAVRIGKTIEVTISGSLPDSCHQARVVDFYPGGDRVYAKDPGAAQVFIEESAKPGMGACLMMLVPWVRTISIVDREHDKVEVFINEHEVAEVPVTILGTEYIVIALTGTTSGCSILPKGALYPAIYTQVFGPAAFAECRDWVTTNATAGRAA